MKVKIRPGVRFIVPNMARAIFGIKLEKGKNIFFAICTFNVLAVFGNKLMSDAKGFKIDVKVKPALAIAVLYSLRRNAFSPPYFPCKGC